MKYFIAIQDVDNLEDELILHFSGKDDLRLNYLGGDDRTQPIIGSELTFSLLVDDCEEGKYDKYFTTDEQKWVVRMYRYFDDFPLGQQIWKGYLLPESYSEPYANKTFLVNFSAVDGLGLLKGKFLPDEFYENEKTVMQFISAALDLTGIGFNVWVSPAIINYHRPRWDQIILNGKSFVNKDEEKDSAYDILSDIVHSMRCQLYQSDATWYIEGINKRQFINVTWQAYRNGGYLSDHVQEKNVKTLSWVAYPDINLKPPYKRTISTHKREQFKLDQNAVSLKEPEFEPNIHTETDLYYYSQYWDINNGVRPYIDTKDNLITLASNQTDEFDETKFISLRERPYLIEGERYRVKVGIELVSTTTNPDEDLIEKWLNYSVFSIRINGSEVYTNLGSAAAAVQSLDFNKSGKADAEMFFTVKESGFLDFYFYEPYNTIADFQISGYKIKTLEIENINEESETKYTVEIEENASTIGDVNLEISDDPTLNTTCWQLDYTGKLAPAATVMNFKFYYSFDIEGKTYHVIDLAAAIYAKKFDVYSNGTQITDKEIIFNYEGGEESVITGTFPGGANSIDIYVRKLRTPVIEREKWLQWTDDFYKVEKKRYGEVVSEIESKMYHREYVQMEGDCKNPIKINDIIRFRYKNQWMYLSVNNCKWDMGNNLSSVTLSECLYRALPFAFAGEDVFSNQPNMTVYTASAFATSPFGTIETYLWEQTEGDSDANIQSPNDLHTYISNMNGDHYQFKLTVTDNNGNQISDTFDVNKLTTANISVVQIEDYGSTVEDGDGLKSIDGGEYEFTVNPDFLDDYSVNLFADIDIKNYVNFNGNGSYDRQAYGYVQITKNGIDTLYQVDRIHSNGEILVTTKQIQDSGVVFSMKKGDLIRVKVYLEVRYDNLSKFNLSSKINFYDYEIATGFVHLNGLPIDLNAQLILNWN